MNNPYIELVRLTKNMDSALICLRQLLDQYENIANSKIIDYKILPVDQNGFKYKVVLVFQPIIAEKGQSRVKTGI